MGTTGGMRKERGARERVRVCVDEWNGKGEIVNDHNRHATLCLGRRKRSM